ncbi:type VI secretion system ATPase TssH [Jannaschia aquimarina]|uniref:ClpB_1 protein n=1 Tax=Jannaschia aquimarina TaxID=935700 RepID=A0A0D1EK04_9RHOB|nr:type VI secretion system ATPase TssH [Jannaschia aquimarina]KIT17904.1 Chaperone protein ClpB [Jannaschia aquimarina]SNT23508.1 type VI secretion system protein VasG [Jannaschia aquimarina]
MADITIEKFAAKMNRAGYESFLNAMRHARGEGNRNVELIHWLFQALANQDGDIAHTLREMGVDRGAVLRSLDAAQARLQKNVTESPGISDSLADALNHAWVYATLHFGEVQIRTGHALYSALVDPRLRREVLGAAPELEGVSTERIASEARSLWSGSEEEQMRPMDGSGLTSKGTGDGARGGDTALARFSVDMTAEAEGGGMDPIVGRDEEIRQIVDVLLRRRQNNPILTGEAGVGKTAVVEGFAQRLAANEVPPALQGTRLLMLDIQAMQAGASMKGEFEQRLKSVIDEVQASPTPIILFIDEAHTLIGAGGQAGTGDAANLLKPALARGTLRTIAATTWSEYRNHIEKDPALTRRFQPIDVPEPDVARCCTMMRGILGPMEAHHGVRISDEALVAAVSLSDRYIPARQLPDKAVSLLDTACARVAVSQAATPARVADLRAEIAALDAEIASKEAERDLGETDEERLAEARTDKEATEARLADMEAKYEAEKALVDRIVALRRDLAEPGEDIDEDAARAEVSAKMAELSDKDPDDRMVYAHVDEQAVASVISDWTGIPAGRMVADELEQVLTLSDTLRERVIGQDHGLKMIAKRIETSRAGLSNPNKPIGVFMLCGPSGVGKTETALALAEQLYGGEQNIITINMSEFQEAHSVSLLKGAPPGYVGYGEGGRLTEAVRRKPYSVVLLDEIEKAHPDIHELFFQVFDKGIMEDGNGRPINFRNTLILLTSNVGTEVIMEMADQGRATPDADELDAAMKPFLLDVFPPALLGRIVTIPYFPLGPDVLRGIAGLKLGAVAKRMREAHGAALTWSDDAMDHIVSQCRDPDSGGRMIDNIIANSILPDLSREVLGRMVSGDPIRSVRIDLTDGAFRYVFDAETEFAPPVEEPAE